MIKIYTDGSCLENPGDGGWAAIIIFDKQKKIGSRYNSVDAQTNEQRTCHRNGRLMPTAIYRHRRLLPYQRLREKKI